MTVSQLDNDPVRTFIDALSPAARHHYGHVAYDATPLVRTACERLGPKELARIVSAGVQWHSPANASGLILYRLKREAGQFDDEGA